MSGLRIPASEHSDDLGKSSISGLSDDELLAEERESQLIVSRAKEIKELDGIWQVSAESVDRTYLVNPQKQTCDCRPGILGNKCRHLFAVENHWLFDSFGNVAQIRPNKRRTYSQNWPKYDKAEAMIASWFPQLVAQLADMAVQPDQERGRRLLSVADKIFGCVDKVYRRMGFRHYIGYMKLAETDGHVHHVPHYNTLANFLKDPETTRILLELLSLSALPFVPVESKFAIDSSGFSTSRTVTWFNKKHGRIMDNREWVKAHIICGVKTNVIVAADVSGWRAHDSPFFVDLVTRVSENFNIREILADKAYLSRRNLFLSELVGATPYIPFKENTLPARWDRTIWGEMYRLFTDDLEEFNEHYHLRNNVETVYSMLEKRFTKVIRSIDSISQINEVLCMLIAHNVIVLIHEMVEHGMQPNFQSSAA